MADIETLRDLDNWTSFRGAVDKLARKLNHWAGMPVPVEGLSITIEPRFPNAQKLMEIINPPEDLTSGISVTSVKSAFWSRGEKRQ